MKRFGFLLLWAAVLAGLLVVLAWQEGCEGAETAAVTAGITVPDFSGPDWKFVGENDWREREGTSLEYCPGHFRDYRNKTTGALIRALEVPGRGVILELVSSSGKIGPSSTIFLLTKSYGWVKGKPGARLRMREGWAKGRIVLVILIIKAEDGRDYWRSVDIK